MWSLIAIQPNRDCWVKSKLRFPSLPSSEVKVIHQTTINLSFSRLARNPHLKIIYPDPIIFIGFPQLLKPIKPIQ